MIRGLIGVLFLVALVVHFFWWIVAIVALVVAYQVGKRVLQDMAAYAEATAAERARLVAQADQQHAWELTGDPRGTFGADYRTIEEWQEKEQ